MKEIIAITPTQTLLSGVIDHLMSPAHQRTTPHGGLSFAHCMVIVPTAESGRQLRLNLAKRQGAKGLLSPKIVQPAHLIHPASLPFPIATKTEFFVALLSFLTEQQTSTLHERWPHIFYSTSIETAGFVGLTKQLHELWETLASNGLTFQDVATSPQTKTFFESHLAEEAIRWQELANLEASFLDFIHEKQRCTKSEAFAMAKRAPAPLDPKIDTIILPALADPLPILYPILEAYQAQNPQLKIIVLLHTDEDRIQSFDEWGRPRVEMWTNATFLQSFHLEQALAPKAINLYTQDEDLATAVAHHYLSAAPQMPYLSILDERLFHPIKLAIQRYTSELSIHNPSLYPLAQSPLGRLTLNLLTLIQAYPLLPWDAFLALVRSEDVLNYFQTHHLCTREELLIELTAYQNEFIPQTIDVTFCDQKRFPLLTLVLATLTQSLMPQPSLMQQVRAFFRTIYQGRTIIQSSETKEFCNAIEALTDLFKEFETPFAQSLSKSAIEALFTTLLRQTSYPLEAEHPNARRTVGWLELAWVESGKVHLVGFNEGTIPDAIVGHPFLPDTLRTLLGLSNNDQRLARDTFLFTELLRSRPLGEVNISITLASAQGDILKPSRLLFICDTPTLIERVNNLFQEVNTVRPMEHLQLPPEWAIQVAPNPPPIPKRISASQIESYLQCPFSYYLKNLLKMTPKGPEKNFSAATFGDHLHKILYKFAISPHNKSADPKEIFASLETCLEDFRKQLDFHHTKHLDLHIEALRAALRRFATAQASIRQEGWEICHVEYDLYLPNNAPLFDDLPFTAHGIIDRIDYHPIKKIYRIIDYKSWDKKERKNELLFVTNRAYIDDRAARNYPLLVIQDPEKKGEKTYAFRSLQLSFYKYILEKADPERFINPTNQTSRIQEVAYFMLNKDTAELLCEPRCITYHNEIMAYMHHALQCLEQRQFWPPTPCFKSRYTYAYDYGHLFYETPERDLGEAPFAQSAGGEQ